MKRTTFTEIKLNTKMIQMDKTHINVVGLFWWEGRGEESKDSTNKAQLGSR